MSFVALTLLAWNEDTVHSYQFEVTKDKTFYYTIVQNDSSKVELHYHGQIARNSSFDTLFWIIITIRNRLILKIIWLEKHLEHA